MITKLYIYIFIKLDVSFHFVGILVLDNFGTAELPLKFKIWLGYSEIYPHICLTRDWVVFFYSKFIMFCGWNFCGRFCLRITEKTAKIGTRKTRFSHHNSMRLDCWFARDVRAVMLGTSTLFSCKFFHKKLYSTDPQRGRLDTWLHTKNREIKSEIHFSRLFFK